MGLTRGEAVCRVGSAPGGGEGCEQFTRGNRNYVDPLAGLVPLRCAAVLCCA